MNQSTLERFIRIVIGGAMVLAGTYTPMGGAINLALSILGLILILTGLAGYCPIYGLLKISARK